MPLLATAPLAANDSIPICVRVATTQNTRHAAKIAITSAATAALNSLRVSFLRL